MNVAGAEFFPQIILETQPAQSPDTNINDLAFFSAHAAAFNRKQKFESIGDIEALVRNVHTTYDSFPASTLERCWLMKSAVIKLILEHGGRNDFDLPRLSSSD